MALTSNNENAQSRTFGERLRGALTIPLLAIFSALAIGAIVIIFTAENPIIGLEKVGKGYWGIIDRAFLDTRGWQDSLVATTPLILTGLAVAVPFKAGLFNIGAEGQYIMGALFGALVGVFVELPPVIHVIVTLFAGFAGGMLWGAIPGLLKAWLHSHEVINTIMLNFVARFFVGYMVRSPLRDPDPSTVQTPPMFETAWIPRVAGRLHWGFLIAVVVAFLVYVFLFKTTWGFSLRTTGQNPNAAEYAGIRPKWEYVLSMMLAGGLAGLAGTIEIQGLNRVLTLAPGAGYGFDAIAVSLLALNHPLAIIPSALLFGALRTGGDFLQIRAGLSVHIVSIFQGLILLFVSAPAIVRAVYRVKRVPTAGEEGGPLTQGWGS